MSHQSEVAVNESLDAAKKAATIVIDVVVVKVVISADTGSVGSLLGAIGALFGDIASLSATDLTGKMNELIKAFNQLEDDVVGAYYHGEKVDLDLVTGPASDAWDNFVLDPPPWLRSDGTVDVGYALALVLDCEHTLSGLSRAGIAFGRVDDPVPTENDLWIDKYHLQQISLYDRINNFAREIPWDSGEVRYAIHCLK
jgi:hypothetical protein